MRNIDQERAAYAWGCVQAIDKSYTKLAKGAPALIMTSGLMQTLAFHADKARKETAHALLVKHICDWLKQRFEGRIVGADFPTVMRALMGTGENPVEESRFYQQATEETLELLRWLRQFAAAVKGDN
jgi:CRISPR-associated protein Cmr5